MQRLENVLDDAVAQQSAPFLVAMIANSAGLIWSGVAGDYVPGQRANPNTLFKIYSMTKAVGSTAAMILIDRGLLKLDDLVENILPGFAQLQVLTGFDGDQPVFRPPVTKATVRHLATHTSGLVYPTWNQEMADYFRLTRQALPNQGKRSTFKLPLVFDPGERWGYGIGIDWLGQVVEAIDGRRIDHFCHDEIFNPLGMTDTVFELTPELQNRLANVTVRGKDGRFERIDLGLPSNPEFYGMGHALYSTAPDYLKFLRLFLNRGMLNGHRVLSQAAVETMLANHIAPLTVGKMPSVSPRQSADFDFFPGIQKSHSLGFLRMEKDVPNMRSAGSQGWAGLLNSHFWFDPERDLAAVFMTQMLPFADPQFMHAYAQFEQAVYQTL